MRRLPIVNDTQNAALDYLARGWAVMPILRQQEKKPAIKWKHLQTRRPHENEVRHWFQKSNFNLGIITGAVSGFFALDVDGEEGFETILGQGDWPRTVETQSRPFRHQLWFALPDWKVSNAVKFLPGLDLRGDGGYVQAPPSIHHTGSRYRWVNHPDAVPMASAPAWLVQHTQKPEIPVLDVNFPAIAAQERDKKYAWAALEKECAKLASAPDGAKYSQLRRSAIAVAGFVPSGAIEAGDIKENLLNVVLPRAKNRQTAIEGVDSAIAFGMAHPRAIPQRNLR
jgi:hypothetical protein